ncbi:MAG: extracellular solute-binding protein [Merdibacter sp.]|nr:extracellular solute-binding protein [Merdibacter sp.]
MRRRWLIVALTAATVLSMLYFGSRTPVLRIAVFSGSNWDVPEADSYSLLDEAIAAFAETHPGVQIEYESGIPKDEYEEWIAQCILRDDLPDILFVPSEYFSTLASTHALQPLDDFARADAAFQEEAYYPASLQTCRQDGTLYALPYLSVPELIFVNKTLLQQEGIAIPDQDWTWDDFLRIVEKVTKDTDGDGVVDQYGTCGFSWQQAAYSNGALFYDEQTDTASFSDVSMIEAITFLRELYGVCDQDQVSTQQFDEGQVAFQPMNYSDYRAYMPYPWRVKKFSGFEWECLPFPSGEQGVNTSAIDTLMVAMSARSTQKKLAWEFMRYLSGDAEHQKQAAIVSQGVSVLPSIMQDEEVNAALQADIPGTSVFDMDVLDTVMRQGVSVRMTQEREQIIQSADGTLSALVHNQQDIENELIRLERRINAYLKK